MATAQFHLSGRKPLQPKNNTITTNDNVVVKQINSKPKQEWREDSNKENLNHHPVTMYANATTPPKKMEAALDLDSSLAEELSAIRKKLERLRLDKEKTEKMLKEREAMLHLQMKDMDMDRDGYSMGAVGAAALTRIMKMNIRISKILKILIILIFCPH